MQKSQIPGFLVWNMEKTLQVLQRPVKCNICDHRWGSFNSCSKRWACSPSQDVQSKLATLSPSKDLGCPLHYSPGNALCSNRIVAQVELIQRISHHPVPSSLVTPQWAHGFGGVTPTVSIPAWRVPVGALSLALRRHLLATSSRGRGSEPILFL